MTHSNIGFDTSPHKNGIQLTFRNCLTQFLRLNSLSLHQKEWKYWACPLSCAVDFLEFPQMRKFPGFLPDGIGLRGDGWNRPLNSHKRWILGQKCGFCWAVIGFWPPWFPTGKEEEQLRMLPTFNRLLRSQTPLAIFLSRSTCGGSAQTSTRKRHLHSFSAKWATTFEGSTRLYYKLIMNSMNNQLMHSGIFWFLDIRLCSSLDAFLSDFEPILDLFYGLLDKVANYKVWKLSGCLVGS